MWPRISDTAVTVELTFDGDFDADAALTFTVETDAIANYNGPALTAEIPVAAEGALITEGPVTSRAEYLLEVSRDISLIHVPLKVTAVNGVPQTIESVGDLYDALGGAATVSPPHHP